MIKIYGYDIYKKRTNNTLLQFFKDYLQYKDEIDNASLDVSLDYTKEFIELVNQNKNKKIAVIGDYDVDGVTATAIMIKGLRKYGVADVYHFIPNRFTDGYGLNERLVDECDKLGVSLIITVDNGVRAFDAISKAKTLGMKVIVTDHHLPADTLPEADININPHIENKYLKTENICGAMVAYLLIKDLLNDDSLVEEKSLAAIGTICDVMPLAYENRKIVKELISTVISNKTTYNKGVDLLLNNLKINPVNFNVESISFTVGPLLNASGRLKSADLALNALVEEDTTKLAGIITDLISLNNERKLITQDLKIKAKEQIKENDLSNIIYIDEANEGLIGVCASSLCEETNIPTFIFTSSEDGYVKGSGRSPYWCNLIEVMTPIIEELNPIAYGGHAGAMGLTLKSKSDLTILKEKLDGVIKTLEHEEKLDTYLRYPDEYSLEEVKEMLDSLAPFGEGLVEPTFVIRQMLNGVSPLGKGHTKLNININGKIAQGLYFFHTLDSSYNNTIHDVFFNIKKEYSSYSRRTEYKLFIKNII